MIWNYPEKYIELITKSTIKLLICDSFIEWVYVLPVLSNPPEQGWSPVRVERLSDFLAGRVVLFVGVETLAAAIAVTAVLQSLKKIKSEKWVKSESLRHTWAPSGSLKGIPVLKCSYT